MLPSAVRLIAECAPGKSLKVFARGQSYELPEVIPEPTPAPPDPLDVMAQRLKASDEQARKEAAEIKALLEQTVRGQSSIVETLMLPVVPSGYDKSGRIVSAQRKKD